MLRSNNHSFFHSSSWAKVLESSYDFKPMYLTHIDNERLIFVMPLMEIRSYITGSRGVSLPFSDQCPPFSRNPEFIRAAVHRAIALGEKYRWKYIEWRDNSYFDNNTPHSEMFYSHDIYLEKSDNELMASFRENNRRNINRAVKFGVSVSIERSIDALKTFFRLNCITRKRHGLPPQPYSFFKSIFTHVISQGMGFVACARHEGRAIAASIFFYFGTNALFKYGASDLDYSNLRPNNLVMWQAIRWLRDHSIKKLNMGRTEINNSGLRRFKLTWGGQETLLRYYRFNLQAKSWITNPSMISVYHKSILTRTPLIFLRLIGRLLHKHIG